MKKLPIGVESYIDVIQECYYVDKTLIIKELLLSPSTSVILFTRPRRFGKSLTLSMIKTFFDKKINNIDYFKNTNIYNDKDALKHFGQYDIIYLNMKDIYADNSNNMIIKTKQIIMDQINEYEWINEFLDNYGKEEYKNIKESIDSDVLFTSSIKKLCKLIKLATNKRPILLIDEYDSPIQTSFEKGYYDEIFDFYKAFYSETLKGNNDIFLSIITGISRTGKLSLFSGLNNLVDVNLLNNNYSKYFGFTKEEVHELLREYKLDHKFDEVNEWYGGYNIGKDVIFNPWSVLNYIQNGAEIDTYWSKTTSTEIFVPAINDGFDICENIEKIINDEKVIINVSNSTDYSQVNKNFDSFGSFLLSTGYVTIDNKIDINIYSIKSVNKETYYSIVNEIKAKLIRNESKLIGYEIKEALINGDSEAFKDNIEKYLLSSFSYFDFESEKNYQILLLTLLSLLFDECYVESEIPSGTGRCNIILRPKTKSSFGAIIEVKYLKSKTSAARLNESSKKALKQILDHKYYQKIINTPADKIYAYGISFYKNSVATSIKEIK